MKFAFTFVPLFALLVLMTNCSRCPTDTRTDWLINPTEFTAQILKSKDGQTVTLTNGLISRKIRLLPNAATVDYQNQMTGEAIIRAVRPAAIVTLDGKRYKIGGLEGQVEQAYLLPEWVDSMRSDPNAFQFKSFSTGEIKKRFEWKRTRWSADLPWPPPGKSVTITFSHPAKKFAGFEILLHYEIYDGLPLVSKWMEIRNNSSRQVQLNSLITENLAVIEPEITVEQPPWWEKPNIHIESDYAFHGMTPKSANKIARWVTDSLFTTQVNYRLQTPCVLECRPPLGPDITIQPDSVFESFRIFELIFDSTDKERKGLALRRMYRTLAPWTTENPIFLHLTTINPEKVRTAIDQCAEVGFEMVILSFGSGLRMERTDSGYVAFVKSLVDYAHQKGIELGGYSLLASRKISDTDDVINPKTGEPGGAIFGNSPCLGSGWGIQYFKNISEFIEKTGSNVLEHDGSYPGDVCASTTHPGHTGLLDSQWHQWRKITSFYKWCRARGIYLNVPDWYFLSGSNKTGIGYREVNWSLPRERQIILGRQNIYDGTWQKTPGMGWTFVPLVQYHGGGAAATLEPLSKHLNAYQAHLVQNFGAGVQACYRGPRLFDSEQTEALVKKWIDWYKEYRAILNSDIIHIRRPDGRDFDGILHVNPALKEKGMLLVFNPTDRVIHKSIDLPLYYTGLNHIVSIREQEGKLKKFTLNRKYKIDLPLTIAPHGFNWYVIE